MKLSVVMPVHNGGAALAVTLHSIHSQTETDYELIVVDDGSTDETASVLKSWAVRDPRIRVLTQANEGVTRALIRACSEARAPIIARHDAGDVSTTDRFARQLAAMTPDVVLSSCWTRWVGPADEPLYEVEASGEDVRRSLLKCGVESIRGLTHHGTAMFRRDAYEKAGGYRQEFRYAQDIDLWIRLASIGSIEIVPDHLYLARFTTGSISATRRPEQMAAMALAIAIRDAPARQEELLMEARTIPARQRQPSSSRRNDARALYFIASCLRSRGDVRYKAYLRDALRANPFHIRSWLMFLR